jgi:lysine N6-hydroxylase/L-ornithine N5-oxygenase
MGMHMRIYDLIGIGFGPSNLALAIALQEQSNAGQAELDTLFIERQKEFSWHPNMLLDHAHMQISFLKDLVTLRNPSSPFSFLRYLHEKKRLQDFINLKTFYPSRLEFNDYLAWAASHFENICTYGEEVVDVLPELRDGAVSLLRVRSRGRNRALHERLTRNLVVGVGGAPNVPDRFLPLGADPRVFHSSRYLSELARQNAPRKMAVIGAGQSAAEVFMDLHNRGVGVDLIMRARAIKPSDDSPFVNEIFNPEYADHLFKQPDDERAALIDEFMNTNYAAPDLALIEQIYDVFYRQKVAEGDKHRFLRRHDVVDASAEADGIRLSLANLDTNQIDTQTYDAVVLATGYLRESHNALLRPLVAHLGPFAVDRHYCIVKSPDFRPSIFLQGCCEATHGLSDTLLSITAIRTDEIGWAVREALRCASQDAEGDDAATADEVY